MATLLQSESTNFTLDTMGRFLCNSLSEALESARLSVAGRRREFDVIVVGGGTFGSVIAERLFLNDPTRSRRILVLEAGPFVLPEHVQNLPFIGGIPDYRRPWIADTQETLAQGRSALNYRGLLYAIGGRSLEWGGWSPELLDEELKDWPKGTAADLKESYFKEASAQIGVDETNDFIYGRLHVALRKQLYEGLRSTGAIAGAVPLKDLPDHPAVRFSTASDIPPDLKEEILRDWLGLPRSDKTPEEELRNLFKLEAPLAVQAQTEPGLFPFNKFSAVPLIIRAARLAANEPDGVGPEADARKRLMIVPSCRVLDLITETQPDNWVRVTGVRVRDRDGAIQEIFLTPSRPDGTQGVAIIALGTIESTRLALNSYKDSLGWRAAQRMGKNLIAHLRSNLTIRVPVTSLANLPAADSKALQASALFVKGKARVDGVDRYFHLQITASGLSRFGADSEAELFKKIPDIEHIEAMRQADDSHVVITLRGIGEMAPHNPDSKVELAKFDNEGERPAAYVEIGDALAPSGGSKETDTDRKTWGAMDALTDQVALIFANGKPFEILGAAGGKTVNVPAGAKADDLKQLHPHANRRDRLGTTHHDAGTLWMGDDPATSVTNEYGRIHDTTNCYVASPALFPTVGSPNPMLTGVALARRAADLLVEKVLPRPEPVAQESDFDPLFNGTESSLKKWRTGGPKGQGFALIDGELTSYGAADFALLYYAPEAFDDFTLKLQFKIFDQRFHNSGVFVRFRNPEQKAPDEIRRRALADRAPIDRNPAWSAVYSGFEVQIDDTAKGDPSKDFYGIPEPNGLWKNRTGAIYKIPAGDLIVHQGLHDEALQQYKPGPLLVPGVWFEYEIKVKGNTFTAALQNLESGAREQTTLFENSDAERGVAKVDGRPAGYIGIQSYPGATVAFRNIRIKRG